MYVRKTCKHLAIACENTNLLLKVLNASGFMFYDNVEQQLAYASGYRHALDDVYKSLRGEFCIKSKFWPYKKQGKPSKNSKKEILFRKFIENYE